MEPPAGGSKIVLASGQSHSSNNSYEYLIQARGESNLYNASEKRSAFDAPGKYYGLRGIIISLKAPEISSDGRYEKDRNQDCGHWKGSCRA